MIPADVQHGTNAGRFRESGHASHSPGDRPPDRLTREAGSCRSDSRIFPFYVSDNPDCRHPGHAIRNITGTLAFDRQDVFQPMTRRRVLIAQVLNDVAAIIDGDSTRNQVFVDHFHQRLALHILCMASLGQVLDLGER
jgi:hypothetical protein